MSNSVLSYSSEVSCGAKSDEKDEDLRLTTDPCMLEEEGTLPGAEVVFGAKGDERHSKIDTAAIGDDNEVVHALEKELNERRKQIVTSFKLQELNLSSGRRASIKSDAVVWKKAEEHFTNGLSSKDQIKSISLLTKAISLKPMENKYYIERGERFLQICDFQSAILNYKKACILDPDNDDYYSRLAFIYHLRGQCLYDSKLYNEALESFSRAAEMKPDVAGYHIRSVACLAALQRHGECLTLVNKRLNIETENADLLIMRARLHQMFRNDSLSYYDIKDALTIDPENREANIMIKDLVEKADNFKEQALKLQILGKTNEALLKFSNAIEANPSHAEYHIFRGALYRQNCDFNSAIDDYLLAMDKRDHDYRDVVYKEAQRQLLLGYNDFAVECFSKGFYEEAVVLLNKAIKEEKKEKGLYINRGDCFFRMFEFDFSLSDYHQALEMDCRDVAIKVRLSVVYNELGLLKYSDKRYAEAFEYFDMAIQLNPRVALYYTSRARARYMLEDYEGAKRDVATCVVLEPNNRSVMSLFTRLFPDKSTQDVLRSPTGVLAAQSVERSINEAFPTLCFQPRELKGSKDLASRSVLPPIPEVHKLKRCLEENDFKINRISKKQVSEKVKKALNNRKSLDYKGPRVFSSTSAARTGNKQASHVGRYKFGDASVTSDPHKSVISHRTRVKGQTNVSAFLQT